MFGKKEKYNVMDLNYPTLPMPKSHRYEIIHTLLEDVEKWHKLGEKELVKNTWRMIAEKTAEYANSSPSPDNSCHSAQ